MENTIAIAVAAGLAGMFGWGFADFFAKKTIDVVGDLTSLVWAHLAGFSIMVTLVILKNFAADEPVVFPVDLNEYAGLAFFGMLQAAVYFLVYKAFSKGRLAIINPIFSSYSAVTVLLSVLFFGEILSLGQVGVLFAIFIGIMLTSIVPSGLNNKIKFVREPGFNYAILGSLLAALWTVLWGNFVAGEDWLIYATIMYGFMTLALLSLSYQQNNNIFVGDKKIWKFFVFIGLAEVVAYVGISYGFSETDHISLIAVLSAAFSIPTLILSRVFLKERISRLQLAGVLLAVGSVTLMPLL